MHVYMKVLAQLVFFLLYMDSHSCMLSGGSDIVGHVLGGDVVSRTIYHAAGANIYTAQFRVFNSYWYLNYIYSLLVLIWWYTGFMKRIEFFSLLLWCWFIWSSQYMTKWAIKGWLLKLHIGNSYFSFTCFLPYIRAFNAYIGYIFIYWHICICGRGCRSNAKIYIIHHLKKLPNFWYFFVFLILKHEIVLIHL